MAVSDQPIRDAATLVLLDDAGGDMRVLLGRRRADLVFLPNVFVFPGGRVDADDAQALSADELADDEARLLACEVGAAPAAPAPATVRALALAAVRETFEETGLIVGAALGAAAAPHAPASAWVPFMSQGYQPRLAPLHYFLRAITPPGRPRRYDTRFFMVNASQIAHRGQPIDDELSELGWFTLHELATLDVPRMTRIAIDELAVVLRDGLKPAAERVVPFYFEENGHKQRAQLSLTAACS